MKYHGINPKKIPAILKELEFRYNTNTTIFMMI